MKAAILRSAFVAFGLYGVTRGEDVQRAIGAAFLGAGLQSWLKAAEA